MTGWKKKLLMVAAVIVGLFVVLSALLYFSGGQAFNYFNF